MFPSGMGMLLGSRTATLRVFVRGVRSVPPVVSVPRSRVAVVDGDGGVVVV